MPPPQIPSADDRPRGTVVIVSVFGALLVFGWLALFFGLFLPRNTP